MTNIKHEALISCPTWQSISDSADVLNIHKFTKLIRELLADCCEVKSGLSDFFPTEKEELGKINRDYSRFLSRSS